MKRILVVDDMAVIREPIAKALEAHGFEAISISGGMEALASIQQQRPDLILLDMMMPHCDGLAVLRALQRTPGNATIPVVVLAAGASKEAILEAGKLGVRDYVLKTQFNLDALVERIHTKLAGGDPNPNISQSQVSKSIPVNGPHIVADRGSESLERLQESAPITTRAQMTERLAQCSELKAMSPTVSRLMEMANDTTCTLEQIAKTIQQDQAVAVKILKLANSAVFSRGDSVDSVAKAVQRIGTNQIRQVVTNLGVMDRFSSTGQASPINVMHFWEHSIACGLIAAAITRTRGEKSAGVDAAFTMGLLHDIGRMIYMEVLGEEYNEVLALAGKLQLPVELVESRLLTINHAQVMKTVLRAWHFPADMITPISMHHEPLMIMQKNAGDSFPEAATLALADRLAHALLLGSSGNDVIYPTDELVTALKLDPQAISRIESEIPAQSDDMKFAMLSRSNQEPWPNRLKEVRDLIPAKLQPIYVGSTRDVDACRIVCDQLRTDATDAPPNVGIVYARGDAAQLLDELSQAETMANVAKLPLIVLSPNGQLPCDPELLGIRHVRILTPTFSISNLSQSLGQLLESALEVLPNGTHATSETIA